PVAEEFVLSRVELVGDVDWTTEVIAVLIVVNRPCEISGGDAGCGVGVAGPGIGIEDGVAHIFVSGAMKRLPAAPGDDANLCARGAAVFRGVVCRKDLDLLSGVHVRGTQTSSVGARAGGGRAVIRNQILGIAG